MRMEIVEESEKELSSIIICYFWELLKDSVKIRLDEIELIPLIETF
jgi:hypothetical protein